MQKSVYRTPESQAIIKYVRNVYTNNRRTGTEYRLRLLLFESFIKEKYPFTVDDLTLSKVIKEDVYDLLSNYVHWLTEYKGRDGFRLSPLSIRQRVDTARTFLECYDIEISPRKFKLKVKLPRTTIQYKEALTKDQIINILNACDNLKLKVYLLCLASTGVRASEAAAIRNKDIDFENSKLNIRAEYAKTRVGRYVFLTQEMKSFFSAWLDYKYRVRKIYLREKHSTVKVKPDKYDDNLVFSTRFDYDDDNNGVLKPRRLCENESDHVRHIYTTLVLDFIRLIKRLNVGYESASKRRHIYTFHSFRRWYKSTLADLISSDFSEWAIGHAGTYSTYYRKSESEKYELFKKVESILTYLDQTALNYAYSDIQSRLDSMEKENLELKSNINNIMDIIRQNPSLVNVKSEVLAKKIKKD
jgi:integrase